MTEPRLRVLIVDDSALFRQSVASVLREMPGVEVIGSAKDGCEAIEKVQQLSPDLVTLDVEMPVMNGIETLREMKRLRLPCRAIMVSSLTESGARVTLDALMEGAFDFLQKPTGGLVKSRDGLREALTEKIEAFRVHQQSRWRPAPIAALSHDVEVISGEPSRTTTPALNGAPAHCEAVVLGLSTGGPQTLQLLLPKLEADFPVPIFIVQHMPPNYTRSMAQRLDELCPLAVREAANGDVVHSAVIYIAPGGHHLQLQRSRGVAQIRLSDAPPENGCRPAVDFTLRSAVELYSGRMLAVILTGMGRDGTEGCRIVKRAGGSVFAQDEMTSAVYGMPKAVIDAGLADRILPIGKIAPAIGRHVHRSRELGA